MVKLKAGSNSRHFGRMFQKVWCSYKKKSVPHYEGMHDLIANLSDFFLKKNSLFMILDSSTGTFLINKISNRASRKKNKNFSSWNRKKYDQPSKKNYKQKFK